MPRFERNSPAPGPQVQGFSGSAFRIDGESYPAVLLTPEGAVAWEAPTLDSLDPGHLRPILDLDPPPEFLLLGTGASLAQPPRALVRALEASGIGVEAMDSRAAARTWGVLRSEGRRIVAAFMPL